MRYRLLCLCLALALLLAGCRIVPDTYVSVKPHADSYTQPAEEEIAFQNSAELRSILRSLIRDGTEEATLTTDFYSGDLEEDFANVVDYYTRKDMEGSYLLSDIEGDIVRAGSYSKINLKLSYDHQYAELKKADDPIFMDGMKEKVEEALSNCDETLLQHVYNYEPTNFNQMVKDYCRDNLTVVMVEPEKVQTTFYPAYPTTGSECIVELQFVYPLDSAELRLRKQVVDIMIKRSGKDSVINEPSDLERALMLYASQISGHSYTEELALTPAYSLFLDRKGDSRAFSAVYRAMCKESNINCITVHGKKNGVDYDWNILDLESGVWHVDVNADAQAGEPELRLLTDAEMEGYEWDTEEYPPCVGLYEPVQPPDDESAPENGEQPPEGTEGETPDQPDVTPEPPVEENPEEPENNA